MKLNGSTKFVLIIVLLLAALFIAQETEAAKKCYKTMSNSEVENLPIDELASLSFDELIEISNRFDYPSQNDLSVTQPAEFIFLPISILADLKFETLLALSDAVSCVDFATDHDSSKFVQLPLEDLANMDLSALMDLTNLNSNSSNCIQMQSVHLADVLMESSVETFATIGY